MSMSQADTASTIQPSLDETKSGHSTLITNTTPPNPVDSLSKQPTHPSTIHERDNSTASSGTPMKKDKGKKQIDPEVPPSAAKATIALSASVKNKGNRAASTRSISSSKRSLKAFSKKSGSGVLSLLLCCTMGGASHSLDNSDKSSIHQQKHKTAEKSTSSLSSSIASSSTKQKYNDTSQRHRQQTVSDANALEQTEQQVSEKEEEKIKEMPSPQDDQIVPPPPIITNPAELNKLATADQQVPATVSDGQGQESPSSSSNSPTSPPPPQSSTSPEPVVWLLPPLANEYKERKCLVLDLDETLVHSSFKIIPNPDFIVPVEIDNQYHNVYVLKRPGVDEFMRKMGEIYEIVVFTASLAKYADPVLDMLDIHRVVKHRLFRESCFNHKGTYIKDLSQLGRDLASTLILDNSPASYIFHTSNAVPVSTWFNDPHDTELTDLVAFLEDLTVVDDVQLVLNNSIDPTQSEPMQ